ncbi:MAG: SLAC1 anion channel family protein [Magnetococcus sp. WYHC-3]
MAKTEVDAAPIAGRLAHFPMAWFAMVMGTSGVALAWRKGVDVWGLPSWPGAVLAAMAGMLFLAFAMAQGLRFWNHPAQVKAEWHHPVRMNFFPTVTISLVLLGMVLAPWEAGLARGLWSVGTAGQLLLTLLIMGQWIDHEHVELHHINPAWFIPVVGNILVPIAGVHFAPAEISWFFFSLGLFFWVVLFTLLFYRMVFHSELPRRLIPTLFILMAPPAVGFLSWVHLVGHLDAPGRILYHLALFTTLLIFTLSRRFVGLPFFLSWWAYSFPLAAMTVATLVYFQHTGLVAFQWLGAALLTLLGLVFILLLWRTLKAVRHREICVEEG